jgi:hypothetical protein
MTTYINNERKRLDAKKRALDIHLNFVVRREKKGQSAFAIIDILKLTIFRINL